MTKSSQYSKASDLPQTFPIFPLPRALLLPRGRLPLKIFEPRYLNMVDDALGAERMLGMVQPTDMKLNPVHPEIFPVGCIGRITAFREISGGRYLITLTGICRYKIREELDCLTLYRQVIGDFTPYSEDLAPMSESNDIGRSRLIKALKAYLSARHMQTDWGAMENASNEELINSLSIIGDFEVDEKQMLLEAPTLVKRAEILTALIEFANAQGAGGVETPLQ